MQEILLSGPSGSGHVLMDSHEFISHVRKFPCDNWREGGAVITIKTNDKTSKLIIVPMLGHGIYMQYCEEDQSGRIQRMLLSLRDRTRLSQVVEAADEYYASEGLFICPELAADAVGYFIETGMLPQSIEWISPAELPEEGNY